MKQEKEMFVETRAREEVAKLKRDLVLEIQIAVKYGQWEKADNLSKILGNLVDKGDI